jgi:hypothetical protein
MTPQYILINEFGSKYYHKDKEMTILHREDGPAVEWTNGVKYWYLNDVSYTEAEFKKRTAKEITLTMDEIADKLGIDVSKLKIKK